MNELKTTLLEHFGSPSQWTSLTFQCNDWLTCEHTEGEIEIHETGGEGADYTARTQQHSSCNNDHSTAKPTAQDAYPGPCKWHKYGR